MTKTNYSPDGSPMCPRPGKTCGVNMYRRELRARRKAAAVKAVEAVEVVEDVEPAGAVEIRAVLPAELEAQIAALVAQAQASGIVIDVTANNLRRAAETVEG